MAQGMALAIAVFLSRSWIVGIWRVVVHHPIANGCDPGCVATLGVSWPFWVGRLGPTFAQEVASWYP